MLVYQRVKSTDRMDGCESLHHDGWFINVYQGFQAVNIENNCAKPTKTPDFQKRKSFKSSRLGDREVLVATAGPLVAWA